MNQLNLPEFKVIGTQSNEHDLLFTVEVKIPPLEGFGVSIPQLLKVIERDEF